MEDKKSQKPLNATKQQGRITRPRPWPNILNIPKPNLSPQANTNPGPKKPPKK